MAKKSAGGFDAQGQRVRGVGAPTATDDAARKADLRYDLALSCAGKPAAGERLFGLPVAVPFTLAAALAGSKAVAGTAATASAAFSLRKNGTEVGTVTFAAGATDGTLAAASAISLAVDDRLTLIAPASQDGTLADIDFLFAGTR